MSLPAFSTQAELFSTAGLSCHLFAPTDRYRLFAQMVYPAVAAARGAMEQRSRGRRTGADVRGESSPIFGWIA